MRKTFISSVKPLENHVLQITFVPGSKVLLDMSPYLDGLRFRSLLKEQVWNSATTNGIFVRFIDVEIAHDEILSMLETPKSAYA